MQTYSVVRNSVCKKLEYEIDRKMAMQPNALSAIRFYRYSILNQIIKTDTMKYLYIEYACEKKKIS